MKNLRSPVGRVLGLGTAKEGAGHWWSQRVTAVGLVFLGPWFLISLLCNHSFEYDAIANWVSRPYNAVLLSLFVGTLVYHSKLGVQVVIEDYVTGHGLKLVSLLLSNFVHVFVGVLGIFAVLRVAFGVVA